MIVDKIYKAIKNKENKTVYDELYIKYYNNETKELIEKYINISQNKHIYNLDIYPQNDYISLEYSYKGYEIYIYIYNNALTTFIDTPEKYDFVEEKKEIEKEEIYDLDIEKVSSFEILFKIINERIKLINRKIDEFNKSIKPNILTNGKALNKVKGFQYYCKFTGLIYAICGMSTVILFSIFIIWFFKDKTSFPMKDYFDVIILILIICFILLGLLCFLAGILLLNKYHQIKNDMKTKTIFKITGTIKKISFIVSQQYRSKNQTLEALVIYINNENSKIQKIICPIGTFHIGGIKNKNKIKKKYSGKKVEINCLDKSKVVLNGLSNILKTTIKYTKK